MVFFFPSPQPSSSTKQLNIQPNSPHEQIDLTKLSSSHVGRQLLGKLDRLHDPLLDPENKSLLLLGTGRNTHRGQKLPDLVVGALRHILRREYVRKNRLGQIKQTVVEVVPLPPIFVSHVLPRIGTRLLDKNRARDENGKEGNSNLGPHDRLDVDTVQDQTQQTRDDVEWRIVNIGQQGWNDCLGEKLDFIADTTREDGFIGMRVCETSNVNNVEMDSQQGDDGESLLVINVSEDAGNGLFPLGVGKNSNERVWSRRTSVNGQL